MFGIGHTELLVIGLVAMLLFGHRLPSLMCGVGRGIRLFKAALNGEDRENELTPERQI